LPSLQFLIFACWNSSHFSIRVYYGRVEFPDSLLRGFDIHLKIQPNEICWLKPWRPNYIQQAKKGISIKSECLHSSFEFHFVWEACFLRCDL
jgi:hypothetical protein